MALNRSMFYGIAIECRSCRTGYVPVNCGIGNQSNESNFGHSTGVLS